MSSTLLAQLSAYVPTPIAHLVYAFPDQPFDAGVRRRLGAVLFADVSGFTSLAERFAESGTAGIEELTDLLNHYFTTMIAEVERHGGQTIKFSGDAFTALFPAGDGLSAATLRAATAGTRMQAAMGNFGTLITRAGDTQLGLKIGIGAGAVITPRVGGMEDRWEYVLAGEALRQAAVAESAAAPAQVVLSPQALELTAGDLWAERLPSSNYLLHGLDNPAVPAPIAPLDWGRLTSSQMAAAERHLRAYVPITVAARLASGQDSWLAELRRMTIMFVGIAGLDYDSDRIFDQLQNLIAATQTTIARYEAPLNKLTVDDKGTVMLILFGAPPYSHEDDPLRALACATELQQVASTQGLRMAIGVATATVVAGPVGGNTRREYTVIGDGVNLAARLMQAAGAGATLADYATFEAVHGRWALEPLPPIQVKGKQRPVRVFRPAGAAGIPAADTRTRMVGRVPELAALARAVEQTEAGTFRIITLVGEPGSGKSRLVAELGALIRPRALVGLVAEASSLGQQQPYMIWRRLLADYFDLGGLSADQRVARVNERLVALKPALVERAPLLSDILGIEIPETVLTANMDIRVRRESLVELVCLLLHAWASEGPLALILEDMHWADSSSWTLTLDVARRLVGHPCLLVLTTRPLATDHPQLAALATLPGHERLTLEELRPDEVLTLAADRLGVPVSHLPPAMVQWLTRGSYGSPFYVEQAMRELAERGILEWHGDQLSIRGELDQTVVPATIQGLIQARLDRLDPPTQLSCKVAAVIGRSFSARALASIHPMPEVRIQLPQHLETLQRIELIEPEHHETDQRYRFCNALTQEVLYQGLLHAQRQALHAAVAAWYEQEFADRLDAFVGLLAEHYARAGNVVRHLEYAERAALQAAARFADAEALSFMAQAVSLLERADTGTPGDRLARTFAILETRAEVYDRLGVFAQERADIEHMVRVAVALRDDNRLARAFYRLAAFYRNTNDFSAARDAGEQAFEFARRTNDLVVATRATSILALITLYQGDVNGAYVWNERGYGLARQSHDPSLLLEVLNTRQTIATTRGDYVIATATLEQQLTLARSLGDLITEANALNGLGVVAEARGDLSTAEEYFRTVQQCFQTIGYRRREAAALTNLGVIAYLVGDYEEAYGFHAEALALFRAVGHLRGEALTLLNTGNTLLALGQLESAISDFESAIRIARQLSERWVEGYALHALGRAAEARGDLAAAEQHYRQSHEIHSTYGHRARLTEDLAALARVALQCHDVAGALALAEQVLARLSEYGTDGLEFAVSCYLTCWEVLHASNQPARASTVLAEGYQFLMARVSRISDANRRDAFLARVPENAQLAAIGTALGLASLGRSAAD